MRYVVRSAVGTVYERNESANRSESAPRCETVSAFCALPACTSVPWVALLCLAPESALYTRAGLAACLRDAYGARESVAGSWKRRIEAWRTGSLAL